MIVLRELSIRPQAAYEALVLSGGLTTLPVGSQKEEVSAALVFGRVNEGIEPVAQVIRVLLSRPPAFFDRTGGNA